jgi:cbb3-type cytochrome oxidase maturation protein
MIVIYLLIPLSIVIAACFLGAFIWAVRSGQFEDTCTPSMRMLWEDRGAEAKEPENTPAPDAASPTRGKE